MNKKLTILLALIAALALVFAAACESNGAGSDDSTSYETCGTCNGEKKVTCNTDNCSDGKVSCSNDTCSSSCANNVSRCGCGCGETNCTYSTCKVNHETCEGTGEVDCGTCGGTGQVPASND